jgi:hypothetical protein
MGKAQNNSRLILSCDLFMSRSFSMGGSTLRKQFIIKLYLNASQKNATNKRMQIEPKNEKSTSIY